MAKIKKLFGGIDMTWPKVIIFALITAVVTAAVCIIPFLKETSFHDMAVNPDWWFVFAVIIIVNCDKMLDAVLKCFTFFLVSQPLIYLMQVPFSSEGFAIFNYYKYWGIITLLTIPGAAVAYLVKKKNWLSCAVLSVATCYFAYIASTYLRSAISDFPSHALSFVFVVLFAVIFIVCLLDDKKHRIAVMALTVLVFVGSLVFSLRNIKTETYLGDGDWEYTVEDDSVVSVKLTGDGKAQITAKHDGVTTVIFENDEGEILEYSATVSGGGVFVNAIS